MQAPTDWVLSYFGQPGVVEAYTQAVWRVNLWVSEARLFSQTWPKDAHILDLGCGAGRVALGLSQLGFTAVSGIDYVPAMVKSAQELAWHLQLPVHFSVGDACALDLQDAQFDGVIFAFNGLMQIPGKVARLKALREIRRILKPGGTFIFTSHNQAKSAHTHAPLHTPQGPCETQGDLYVPGIGGHYQYIHAPNHDELRSDLAATQWTIRSCIGRWEIANEPEVVRQFSDDCWFWILE